MPNEIFAFKKKTVINRRAFLGFTAFDIIHLVCAVSMMIFAYLQNPIKQMLAAECGTEIALSLLLVAFIKSLAEQNHHHDSFHALFTFAWLTAAASLFLPASFTIPEVFAVNWDDAREVAAINLNMFYLGVALIAFALLVVCSFMNNKRSKRWNVLIRIAMVLILVSVPLEIASKLIMPEEPFVAVFATIKALAPITPAILCFTLWKEPSFATNE